MRNGKLRGLLITVMLLVFLAGLASILYPYIWGAAVDSSIASTAKDFLEREGAGILFSRMVSLFCCLPLPHKRSMAQAAGIKNLWLFYCPF